MTRSMDLRPGMQLRHTDGAVVTLARRKSPTDDHHGLPFHPGWWVGPSGGLSDSVIDDPKSDWELVDPYHRPKEQGMEPTAAPHLTSAPEPEGKPDPLTPSKAATAAEVLATVVAETLSGLAETLRTRLAETLQGQTRKSVIDLVLDVVEKDGLDTVDLRAIVKAARPVPEKPATTPATTPKAVAPNTAAKAASSSTRSGPRP